MNLGGCYLLEILDNMFICSLWKIDARASKIIMASQLDQNRATTFPEPVVGG